MNNDKLPGWTSQAKELLEDSAQNLDAATASRLNRARQGALAAARPRRMRPSWFVPAGLASACALLLAVAVAWHVPGVPTAFPDSQANAVGDSDMDLVSSDDGIEFYQDLDFYAWLDAQSQDGNG